MRPTVETYNLRAANGRHIRKATQVRFPDGQVIRFVDRLSKGEAIRNAEYQVSKQPQVIYKGSSGRDARSVFHQASRANPDKNVVAIRHDLNSDKPSLVGATFEVRIESQS